MLTPKILNATENSHPQLLVEEGNLTEKIFYCIYGNCIFLSVDSP